MSDAAILVFVLAGTVMVLWWALQGLAQWRAAYVLNDLAEIVARGEQLTKTQVATLIDAVSDAMPLRDQDAAQILRRVRTASPTRVCLMLVVAGQGITTRRGARLLQRACEILAPASPSVLDRDASPMRSGRQP